VTAHHIIQHHISSLEMFEKLLENELMPLINKSLNAHPQFLTKKLFGCSKVPRSKLLVREVFIPN
jgi:hypothetical protein